MASRRYTRRTRSSLSAEQPNVVDTQSDSDGQDNNVPAFAPVTAPVVAAAGPSNPGTPANASNRGTPQNKDGTQSIDRAVAASLTSPVRKQRRVTNNDAPSNRHHQDLNTSSAAGQPATPRPQLRLVVAVMTSRLSPAVIRCKDCWETRGTRSHHTRMQLWMI